MILACSAGGAILLGLVCLAVRDDEAFGLLWSSILRRSFRAVLVEHRTRLESCDRAAAFTAERIARLRREGQHSAAERLADEARRYAVSCKKNRSRLRLLERLARARGEI